MAKSRRKNRRLRRTVRRTFGALCMITAIIVAAIPFPDAEAGTGAAASGANGLPYEYEYDAAGTLTAVPADLQIENIKFEDPEVEANIDKDFKDDLRVAYTISRVGGNWQMDWQFRYSSKGDGSDGYITLYNNQYQVDEIDLKYRVFSDYLYINQADSKNFNENPAKTIDVTMQNTDNSKAKTINTLSYVYVLDGDSCLEGDGENQTLDLTKSENHDFFTKNFQQQYDEYKKAYEAYLKDKSNNPKPEALKRTYRDIYPTDVAQMQFLCDQLLGPGTAMSLKFVDKRSYNDEGIATGWEKIYVPCLTNKPEIGSTVTIEGQTYYCDENGFLANKFNTIRGIAKNAFKDVTNVRTLTMAEEISFIGNSAFENSFVQSVRFPMGSVIGNNAFKNCTRLRETVIPEGVKEIGKEAFYGTIITDLVIPDSIKVIGPGAFAKCGQLANVTFKGTATEKTVGDGAFYDCLKLNSVNFGEANIKSLGDCAFAVSKVVNGTLTDFAFPNTITDADDIGRYVLGNRTNLKRVTMPRNLGTASESTLKNDLFFACAELENVTFPDSAVLVSYPKELFSDVTNPSFYVRGPKNIVGGETPTKPRKSTWLATFNGEEHVPYVYTEDGQDYYEISDGTYIQVIDGTGMLVSCTFVGTPDTIGSLDGEGNIKESFKIPSHVGVTPVIGISDGCFGDVNLQDSIINYIKVLEVEDGSGLNKIEDGVFKDAPILEYAYLGDSVQEIGKESFDNCKSLNRVDIGNNIVNIGSSAFEDCENLKEISFANPVGGAASFPVENIGEKAFSTKGDQLTLYGLIESGYGPFEWAMQENNFMDPAKGIRVCYKSPRDTVQGMTVVLDNSNNLPTLVDYPVCTDDAVSKAIEAKKNGEALTPEQESLINSAFHVEVPNGVKSVDVEGYLNSSSRLFGDKPDYTSNQATIEKYFTKLSLDYKGDKGHRGLFNSNYNDPLGDYVDGSEEQILYEKDDQGNDFMETVSMPSVVYLPDQCFYSCERLSAVDLGSAMEDAGKLPFLHADNVASVGCTSGKYSYNNGILYKNLDDGSKNLTECLPGRGNVVGSSSVTIESDPDLATVSSIDPGAFRDCKNITNVDFTGANEFDEIPEECFYGAEILTEVDMPQNVKIIGDKAFAGTGNYTKAIVRGHEVGLGKNAFGEIGNDEERVKQPFLVSYRDSAVRAAAKKQGANVDEVLDEMITVKFYMPDAKTLISTEFLNAGSNAKKVAPDEAEMKEKGLLKEGETLLGWNGSEEITNITKDCFFIANIGSSDSDKPVDPNDPNKPVDPNDPNKPVDPNDPNRPVNPDDPNKPVNPNDPNKPVNPDNPNKPDGDNTKPAEKKTLTVVYGNGSGTYAKGTTVIISAIEPPAGKEFYKWTTDNTGLTIASATSAATTVKMPDSDATVTATYRDKSSVSGNNSKPVNRKDNSSTQVTITKPGISNTDKAYASVSGSTDNYIVKITETTEAANAVATALSNEYANMEPVKYFAMDISLYDKKGNKVTSTNGLSVNITMPIPDALVQYGGNNKVGAVVNGTTLEKLNCKFTTVSGIPCITFTANHFSPYTVYVDTSNLSANVLDSTPKTGDGIHPKWFLSVGLACLSIVLFMKKDRRTVPV